MSMWSKKSDPRVLEPQNNLPSVKSPLELARDLINEYESLLYRIYYRVGELGGIKKATTCSIGTSYYSAKLLFEQWLQSADAKQAVDAEREKIAKIVREELESKVNKKCLKQS